MILPPIRDYCNGCNACDGAVTAVACNGYDGAPHSYPPNGVRLLQWMPWTTAMERLLQWNAATAMDAMVPLTLTPICDYCD